MSTLLMEDGVVEDFCTNAEGLRGLIKPQPTLTPWEESALRLGFTSATPRRRQGKPSAYTAAQYYEEWTGFRLAAWSHFFGVHYPQGQWRHYRFDKPPLHALKAIEAAIDADVFQEIEIWTPEDDPRQRTFREAFRAKVQHTREKVAKFFDDPVAVGIVDGRYFPIVRWGEASLISESTVMRVGGFRAIRQRILD